MNTGITGILLIIANIAFSYKGFTNTTFFDGYKFEVNYILRYKDYKRLVTSGFLHIGWAHLIFNMVSLFAFSAPMNAVVGDLRFLVIYFVSLIGGNLLALFVHRHHGDYSAVGASGAVSGVIFACLALFPGMGIGIFGLVSIPGWLYGLTYVVYSIYGIKTQRDNIGHEAHLGGALIGMAAALLMVPAAFLNNYVLILMLSVPILIFLCLIITRPEILLIDGIRRRKHKVYSIDQKYNEEKLSQQQDIDRILDKIAAKGMNSLNKKEKEKLERYSRGKN